MHAFLLLFKLIKNKIYLLRLFRSKFYTGRLFISVSVIWLDVVVVVFDVCVYIFFVFTFYNHSKLQFWELFGSLFINAFYSEFE